MKIFSPQKTTASPTQNSPKAGKGKSLKKDALDKPMKKNLTPDDIKEKLAAHVETSDTSKNLALKNSQRMGDGFLINESKPAPFKEAVIDGEAVEKNPNSKDFVLKSDVGSNNPQDTNTQEKLKAILAKGAFSFNGREKEALEKILGN